MKHNRWADAVLDHTWAAVAAAAWPEDWRDASRGSGNARNAARTRLLRRREGFRAAGAVLAELGEIQKRARGVERSLSRVNVAAKALRLELVTLGILAESDEQPRLEPREDA